VSEPGRHSVRAGLQLGEPAEPPFVFRVVGFASAGLGNEARVVGVVRPAVKVGACRGEFLRRRCGGIRLHGLIMPCLRNLRGLGAEDAGLAALLLGGCGPLPMSSGNRSSVCTVVSGRIPTQRSPRRRWMRPVTSGGGRTIGAR
jgi:hypothetical protein